MKPYFFEFTNTKYLVLKKLFGTNLLLADNGIAMFCITMSLFCFCCHQQEGSRDADEDNLLLGHEQKY